MQTLCKYNKIDKKYKNNHWQKIVIGGIKRQCNV